MHDGRSVDTTMGFTPLEGLVMATRSGSVDPGLLLWVQRHGELGAEEIERALDRESGLLGLSGRSADMREVLAGDRATATNAATSPSTSTSTASPPAIAAMTAALGGLDALVFTGGVGENSPPVRAAAVEATAFLGISLDPTLNAEAEPDTILSPAAATAAVVLVEAREDLEIAAQVRAALGGA